MGQLITKDYQGMSFTFREDGYFNMTKAAQHFGKRLDNFMAIPSTHEYVRALGDAYSLKISELVDAKAGRYGGTFGHPKIAVRFAQWLDARFAVWCDAVIEDILTKKADLTITQPATSATVQVSQQMPEFMLAIQQMAQGISCPRLSHRLHYTQVPDAAETRVVTWFGWWVLFSAHHHQLYQGLQRCGPYSFTGLQAACTHCVLKYRCHGTFSERVVEAASINCRGPYGRAFPIRCWFCGVDPVAGVCHGAEAVFAQGLPLTGTRGIRAVCALTPTRSPSLRGFVVFGLRR